MRKFCVLYFYLYICSVIQGLGGRGCPPFYWKSGMKIAELKEFIEKRLAGTDIFPVNVSVSAGGEIEVAIDSDTSVGIDACIELSHAIEAAFDRDMEDYSLTVSSSGIGEPLIMERQLRKHIGGSVEVLLKNGIKYIAYLKEVASDSITISYEQMAAVEGKKRKQKEVVEKSFKMEEIKSIKEYLDFK